MFLRPDRCLARIVTIVAAAGSSAGAGVVWMPAFPEAEGFGARAVGGRGGQVIEVTNLADSGPGSLRAAIEASGPRTVVFRTGGTINLAETLLVTEPYLTIAGQSAPGGGICLRNGPTFSKYTDPSATLDIRTHDVILRHLRIRSGTGSGGGTGSEADCIQVYDPVSYNIMIDHCSLSWAVDENFSTWNAVHDLTMQWCIISEGLRNSIHSEGAHSMGVLLGSAGAGRMSLHHNLMAHNMDRNPRLKTSSVVDVVNNVSYDYDDGAGLFSSDYDYLPVNYVGNFVKQGPSPSSHWEVVLWELGGHNCSVYVSGNLGPHRTAADQAENLVVDPSDRGYVVSQRFAAVPVVTDTSQDAYSRVLAGAGATLPTRDAVDTRVVNDVQNTTGGLINSPSQVGGWPVLAAGIPPADGDHDGMPDGWEDAHELDPMDPADGPVDDDGDGYTNLEESLNGTDPHLDPLGGVRLLAYGGSSPDGATLAPAGAGRHYRTDRAFTLSSLPSLSECAFMVRYAEADSSNADADFITLSLGSTTKVTVGYDLRGSLPAWLNDWTATGQNLTALEAGGSGQSIVFSRRTRTFGPGEPLVLPGNRAQGGAGPAGYIVLLEPVGASSGVNISQQPEPQLASVGQGASFSVVAEGEGSLRYRWQRNGQSLADGGAFSGTSTATLQVTNVSPSQAGEYRVRIEGSWCTVLSAAASLTLKTPCDYDGDTDVDLADFGHFQACLGSAPGNASCFDTRYDEDADTDSFDFQVVFGCLSGTNVPAAPRCRP